MKILLIEPSFEPRAVEIDGSLTSLQNLVGGLIQAVYPFEDGSIIKVGVRSSPGPFILLLVSGVTNPRDRELPTLTLLGKIL